jgi:tetratricopeptide (TPR) repeat protein
MNRLKKLLISLALLACASSLTAQDGTLEVEIIRQKFRNFEYDSVITYATKALAEKEHFSRENLIDIYELKAISHFSLLEMNASLSSFLEILKIDPAYSLDPVKTSPKILSFFEELKKSYQPEVRGETARLMAKVDTIKIADNRTGELKSCLVKSMVLPGWGHIQLEKKTKGIFLTAAGFVSLGLAINYAIDTESKEKSYLNETDMARIESKYDAYNRAYRLRNIFMTSFAVVWLYTQADLLFFQKFEMNADAAVIQPHFYHGEKSLVGLSIHF